jgi:hypothetical protein
MDEVERAARSLLNMLLSYASLLLSQPGNTPTSALNTCIQLLRQGLLSPHERISYLFSNKLAEVLTIINEAPGAGSSSGIAEVHFEEGSDSHDHMDPSRMGPLFWEECLVQEATDQVVSDPATYFARIVVAKLWPQNMWDL